ncbi:MAG: radical SAM protein [Syntrophales bacterium]|nr:radical SAM protein [Syntrophales bacterium]
MDNYLFELLKNCKFCPRKCGVDRTKGERGFCGVEDVLQVASALPHFGEEPPISGSKGAGTIFFSGCNLRCIFCQNYQISHAIRGEKMTVEDLAQLMLSLEAQGCHNIEAVTPTPHIPFVVAGLVKARLNGLTVPFINNSSGYEELSTLKLLKGLVDIYMPDFKFGNDEIALRYAKAPDYVAKTLLAIKEMADQVGNTLETKDGIARRGLLIRHLVLPGEIENSLEVLRIISREISTEVPLSLMSQYTPTPKVKNQPPLNRRILKEEYDIIIEAALDMGFEVIYIQELNDKHIMPDFDREKPFNWDGI